MEFEIKNWDSLGSLRIGSNVTIGNNFLPQCVKAFHNSCPGIEIEVTVDNSARIEQLILNSKLDFALIEGPVFNHFIKR
jgi:DNA-binding transcriptional LysR family regulator